MSSVLSELAFETALEQSLLTQGYVALPRELYNRERALFPQTIIEFIQTTQPQAWSKLEALHGDKTGERILLDLNQWLDSQGMLSTLRHGFKCYGRTLRLAYFKAAHGLNPDLEARYAQNKLGITRQLRYSPKGNQSLDVVLSVNGLPVITLELKNPLTGQTAEDAVKQYRYDRDPREKLFEFKKRCLVHFAVDPDTVQMTTRLAGDATQFLPFNKGLADGKGAGNPPDPLGRSYRTAYLWEEVLQRDSLLDLLARFLHLQLDEKFSSEGKKVRKESLVFPRYHQLRAVRRLVASSVKEGVGNNYLVEHSAGSGKSNTIAWLAHRLSSLHDEVDKRVFDSVVVITDRRVLDKQLQDTIYQFEHRQGVVQKIDSDSRQLAQALEGGVPIIITTLQKFPFVSQQLVKIAEDRNEENASGLLATKRYAVIIDEAHSSQSGETATDLKEVLGGEDLFEAARKQAEEETKPDMTELFRSMAKRGKQANLSFFAFTATPKYKTFEVFGRNKNYFDKYSMKQAIEEGFILDVLKNYTTYKAYYKLLKATEDDPNVARKKAAKELSRFMRLHPYQIAQKTQIIVEHFQAVTRHKINGKAKAMVVTTSRLEAVRFKESFDRYIRERNYPIKTLVAFSGTVLDDKVPNKTYTEETMNQGIREKELPERFATDEYQVLLVADKYQTGFDQPLLHSMYVDKRLAGIQAVQTLSRLNRIHPFKEDTFVMDFVNDRQEIYAAFKQFYEGAEMGEDVEAAQLYELQAKLNNQGIYLLSEVEQFAEVYFKPKQKQNAADHRALNALLDPAVDRFRTFLKQNEEEAELWRGLLQSFRNVYGFLSQVIPYQDSDLERLYVYLRYLALKLPKRSRGDGYHFDEQVRLEYYRLQKVSEGSINLSEGTAKPLDGPSEVGTGLVRDEPVKLSKLIDLINDRFGTDFNEADQLFFDQIVEAALRVEMLEQAATANPLDKFQLVFKQILESLFIERMDTNEEIFTRFMGEGDFHRVVTQWLGSEVYKRFRNNEPSE
jgi:type I restriction enzyme, R subunit